MDVFAVFALLVGFAHASDTPVTLLDTDTITIQCDAEVPDCPAEESPECIDPSECDAVCPPAPTCYVHEAPEQRPPRWDSYFGRELVVWWPEKGLRPELWFYRGGERVDVLAANDGSESPTDNLPLVCDTVRSRQPQWEWYCRFNPASGRGRELAEADQVCAVYPDADVPAHRLLCTNVRSID